MIEAMIRVGRNHPIVQGTDNCFPDNALKKGIAKITRRTAKAKETKL